MMKFKTRYYTSTGVGIPVTISIKRLSRERIINKYIESEEERNSWCTHGKKPCAQYDTRPCCPPRIPIFEKLRKRSFLYLIHLKFELEDFLESYPQYKDIPTRTFFIGSIIRVACRKVLFEAESELKVKGDTIFKVGGCSSCSFKKGKGCKTGVTPALEGVGIKVCEICEKEFDTPVLWHSSPGGMQYFSALGGIYTDQELDPEDIKRELKKVCLKYKPKNGKPKEVIL